ncbi:MAG: hypothetical protein IJ151_03390 [Bacteroidales bacterium]|nr:hypothetical protein [Bacteroidales bacterium]
MKHLRIYFLAILYLAAVCCTYPFDAEMKDSNDVPVVEGNIIIGSYSYISVDRIIKSSGKQSTAPLSFIVKVEGEDGTAVQGTGDNPYQLDTRDLPATQKYRLVLTSTTDNSVYMTDFSTVLGTPEVDDFKYEITGNLLTFKVSLHSDSNPFFQISYDEEWEYHSWTDTKFVYNRNSNEIVAGNYPYYTCWNHSDYAKSTTMSAEAYEGFRLKDYPVLYMRNTDRRISTLYRLKMKVSLIPEDSYRYWQNLDKISQPDGDLFSPIPSSMRGNLYKEGDKNALILGYVGFAASHDISLFFNNEKEDFYVFPRSQVEYMLNDRKESGMDPEYWSTLYSSGYWPYDTRSDIYGNTIGYIWITQDCVDCRRQGGSTTKPADWTNESTNKQEL